MKRKKSFERRYQEFLAKQKKSCRSCGYYKNGYCNDLDVRVDPDYPVCSDNNYYA